jgi:sulfhydrogenase subunit beta (sulfur reductase)
MEFLSRKNLFNLLDGLKSNYQVFVPHKKGTNRFYKRYTSPADDIIIGEVRTTEPLKGFFTHAREKVAEEFNPEAAPDKNKPFAIVGVKACDLKGFLVQDQVYLNQSVQDPFYARAREDNLIISADCTLALETCFCLALDHNPYPEGHFDINLSEVEGGFIVEAGSPKGRQVLEKHKSLFQEASQAFLDEREARRKKIVAEVVSKIEENEVPYQESYQGMVERNYDSGIWEDEAKRCVECGACNMICPTCHCFMLTDQKSGDKFARFRNWDSCMLRNFAKVAGGGNPRSRLWMRLRNRFEKKFDFFPKVADFYACTGCGRCISACPAKIDIRRVLKRLVHNE